MQHSYVPEPYSTTSTTSYWRYSSFYSLQDCTTVRSGISTLPSYFTLDHLFSLYRQLQYTVLQTVPGSLPPSGHPLAKKGGGYACYTYIIMFEPFQVQPELITCFIALFYCTTQQESSDQMF